MLVFYVWDILVVVNAYVAEAVLCYHMHVLQPIYPIYGKQLIPYLIMQISWFIVCVFYHIIIGYPRLIHYIALHSLDFGFSVYLLLFCRLCVPYSRIREVLHDFMIILLPVVIVVKAPHAKQVAVR